MISIFSEIIPIVLFVFVMVVFSMLVFRMFRDNSYSYRCTDCKKHIRIRRETRTRTRIWWPVHKQCVCKYCKSDGKIDDMKISDDEYLDIWTYHNICMAALYGE